MYSVSSRRQFTDENGCVANIQGRVRARDIESARALYDVMERTLMMSHAYASMCLLEAAVFPFAFTISANASPS